MKKAIALLLSMLLCLSLLTACGSASAVSASEAATSSAAAESAAEAPAEAAEAPAAAEPAESSAAEPAAAAEETSAAEEASAAEETATDLYTPVAYELPLFEETQDISLFYVLRGAMGGGYTPTKDSDESIFWCRLQENLNVNLEFTEPSESAASEMYNLMIAGGDMVDIICENNLAERGKTCAYNGGYDKAIADEVYLNLMEYLDYAPNYAHYIMDNPENYRVAITDDGNLPAFYTINNETALNNMGEAVNVEMLEATGMEAPDTVDGWVEVAKAMKSNGVLYPLEVSNEGSIQQGMFTSAIGATLDTTILIDNATGNLTLGVISDTSREYLELFIECNKEGLLNPDWINLDNMDFSAFNSSETATRNAMATELSSYKDNYGIEVEAVPIVHREGYGDKQLAINSTSNATVQTNGSMVLTTDCRDIEACMKFLDWFYTEEGADDANFGFVEGEVYDVVDGKKQINANYENYTENNVQMKNIYTHDGDFGLVYPNLRYATADETAKKAYDLWASGDSSESAIYTALPSSVALTSEESEAVITYLNDMDTYIETTVDTWLDLGAELDDASWDAFVANCEGFHLDEILDAYTAAYERYQSK